MSAPVYWIGCLIIALTVLALPMPLLVIPLSPVVHETIEQQQKMRLEQTQQQREALQSVELFSKERINYGRVIGYYINPQTDVAVPTTNGMVHYGKNGVHIVPVRP